MMEEEGLIFTIIIWLFLIEILVGFIQLIGALVRTIIKLNSGQQLGKLKTYWIIVGIYFGAFVIQYYLLTYLSEKSFAHSTERFDETTGEYNYSNDGIATDYFALLKYSYIGLVTWTALAWLIAIWYCTNIVFTKKFISKIKLKLKK